MRVEDVVVMIRTLLRYTRAGRSGRDSAFDTVEMNSVHEPTSIHMVAETTAGAVFCHKFRYSRCIKSFSVRDAYYSTLCT